MGTTAAQLVPKPLPFPLTAFQSRDTGHKGGRQEVGRVLAVPAGRDPIAGEGVGPAHHCGSGVVSLVPECVAAGSCVPIALWGSCPLAGSGERLKHPPVPQGCPQLPSPACVPRGKCVPACYPEPCSDLMSPLGSAWGRGVLGDWQRCGSAHRVHRDHCLPHHPQAPLLPLQVTASRVGTEPQGVGQEMVGPPQLCWDQLSCPEPAWELMWQQERVSHRVPAQPRGVWGCSGPIRRSPRRGVSSCRLW